MRFDCEGGVMLIFKGFVVCCGLGVGALEMMELVHVERM